MNIKPDKSVDDRDIDEKEREARFHRNMTRYHEMNDDLSQTSVGSSIYSPEMSIADSFTDASGQDDTPVDRRLQDILDELDDIGIDANEKIATAPDASDESEFPTKIYDPVRHTPWDRARAKELAAEQHLSAQKEGTLEYAVAKNRYDDALRLRKIEDERDSDPDFRKYRAIDADRAGLGRDEYNSSRRNKRTTPNIDLSDKTEAEKKKHKQEQSRARTKEG